MARQQTKTVALDLAGGIFTNATGLTVGPRLALARNVLPDWRNGRRLGLAPTTGASSFFSVTDASHFSAIGSLPLESANFALVVGRGDDGKFAAWRDSIRLDPSIITNLVGAASMALPAAIATWETLAAPTVYFGHRDVSTIYQITTNEAVSVYAPTNVPSNATAMAVHLLRLWIAETIGATLPRFSRIWYTDPLDPSTIRPEAFFPLEDLCRAMFRTTPGDVGMGAAAQLVFGCQHSFVVLDGDPTLGNSDLRILDRQRGLAGQSLAAETEKGAAVIATDGEGYLIPPGAGEMVPIGESIRNRFTQFSVEDINEAVANGTGHSVLLYDAPYLLYWPGTENAGLVLDLSAQTPSWWGPVDMGAAFRPAGAILINDPDDQNDRRLLMEFASGGNLRVFEVNTPALGQPRLESGYLFEPGMDVRLIAVTLLFPREASEREVTVHASNEVDTTTSVTHTVPTGSGHVKLTYVFDHKVVRGAFLKLAVTGTLGRALNPESCVVEYHVDPRVDPQA